MALRSGRLTISTLVVVATVGAIGLGVLEEAALLVVVFSLGEVLEDYAADKARGSIRALMALVPPTATRREPDGATVSVPVEGWCRAKLSWSAPASGCQPTARLSPGVPRLTRAR
jgi:Cd2+/Zn2+-exporting ATPase